MSELRYLTRADVRDLLPDLTAQIDLVEATYRAMAQGRVEMPPKPGIHPRPDAFIHAMPAYLADADVAALKWVSGYPSNQARGLPYISGLLIVNDADTGAPEAIMDAAEITAARTAAASGACVRAFAPPGWRSAAILGCGEQGRFHAEVLRMLGPEAEIRVFDPDRGRMAAMPGAVSACDSADAAVRGADVLVTLAPILETSRPFVPRDWLGERFLALPGDFDACVEADVLEAADLFLTDDAEQYAYYQRLGRFPGWGAPAASDGQAMIDGRSGERVVCCNMGVGALDAAFAASVLRAARERSVGLVLPPIA